MKNASLSSLTAQIGKLGHFFFVHNRMIYFVLFISVLIGAIISLNIALGQESDEIYRGERLSETQSARFDTGTIEKIKTLNSKQQTTTDALPSGVRTNPFGE